MRRARGAARRERAINLTAWRERWSRPINGCTGDYVAILHPDSRNAVEQLAARTPCPEGMVLRQGEVGRLEG